VMETSAAPERRADLKRLQLAQHSHPARAGERTAIASSPKQAPDDRACREAGFAARARSGRVDISPGARAFRGERAAPAMPPPQRDVNSLDRGTN
jgi:hypothetical protein